MTLPRSIRSFCARKPFSPWLPVCVGIGTALGAGPHVPMAMGVAGGVVAGVLLSLLRLR